MDWRYDPSLVLYVPFYELDGASFMSRDAYGHLATVYGALWKLQGREFDGDDYISIPDRDYWSFAGDFSLIVWAKWTADNAWWINALLAHTESPGTNKKWYFSYDGGQNKTVFHLHDNVTGESVFSNAWTRIMGTFYCVGVTRIGSLYTFYLNGEANGTATEDLAIVATAAPLKIGHGEGAGGLIGTVGEALIYPYRGLNGLEMQRNYLASKWRYQ